MSSYVRDSTSQFSVFLTRGVSRIGYSQCPDSRLLEGPDIKEALSYILFRRYHSSKASTGLIGLIVHLRPDRGPAAWLLSDLAQAYQGDRITQAGKSQLEESSDRLSAKGSIRHLFVQKTLQNLLIEQLRWVSFDFVLPVQSKATNFSCLSVRWT